MTQFDNSLERIRNKLKSKEVSQKDKASLQNEDQSTVAQTPCAEQDCCVISDPSGPRFHLCKGCNPRFSCPKCLGTGKVTQVNPETMLEEQLAEPCDCSKKERSVRNLNHAKLPGRYLDSSLSIPPLLRGSKAHTQKFLTILEKCDSFANMAEETLSKQIDAEETFFLLMHGPVGAGKTHLAAALLRRIVLATGGTGKFVEFQQLLFELRRCYADKKSEDTLLAPLRAADVLVIDELGKNSSDNAWQMERLDDLINSRYNAGRITIFTTNYSPMNAKITNSLAYGINNPPASEGFWTQTLADKLGLRMYDRLMEVATVVDFSSLPSQRHLAAEKIRKKVSGAGLQER